MKSVALFCNTFHARFPTLIVVCPSSGTERKATLPRAPARRALKVAGDSPKSDVAPGTGTVRSWPQADRQLLGSNAQNRTLPAGLSPQSHPLRHYVRGPEAWGYASTSAFVYAFRRGSAGAA